VKRILLLYIIAFAAGCGPAYHQSAQEQMTAMVERDRVTATATKLFICTDDRNWDCVKDVFAPEVLFDMTSLAGGEPVKMTPEKIASTWEQGLKSLKAIHHQAGNYQVTVEGNEADLFCYGIAYHYLPNATNRNTRTFVGSYTMHLIRSDAGWKIDKFRFNLKFIDGNKDLEGSAKTPS
jgi:hypothetical protein